VWNFVNNIKGASIVLDLVVNEIYNTKTITVKARRSRSMNKKFKNISARMQFLMHIQSTQEEIEQEKINRYKTLSRKIRNMINVNVKDIDDKIRRKCINLSFDLQEMNSADRLAFLYDDPSFPKNEKILMLNTCISIMETIEEYEVCATLDRMRQYMSKHVAVSDYY
jgi:hypothetical protein